MPWKMEHFYFPHLPYINKNFDINFLFQTCPPPKEDEEFKKIHPEPLQPNIERRYADVTKNEKRTPFKY